MRTTLDLPEDLLNKAMKVTGSKTKTALIIQALNDVITKDKVADIKSYKGQVDLDINLDELRARH